MFTSGIVATAAGHRIALFFSGRQHAGENLEEVLRHRASDLPPPIQMCDALSRNLPEELQRSSPTAWPMAGGSSWMSVSVSRRVPACAGGAGGRCTATTHRRDSVNDARGTAGVPPGRKRSGDGGTATWLARQFEERRVEPNSGLGAAITYLLRHWEKLTLFLRQPGAPLDNNICERALKKAILHRKNALFLQDPQRRPRGRSVHEPDPHVRAQRGQSVRLPHRAVPPRRRSGRRSGRVDAVELSGQPRQSRSRVVRPALSLPRPPSRPSDKEIAGLPKGHDRLIYLAAMPPRGLRLQVALFLGRRPCGQVSPRRPKEQIPRPA